MNHQPLIRSVDEPTRADPVSVREAKQSRIEGVRGGLHRLFERHAVLPHPLRIDLHEVLLEMLAPDGDVRDALYAQ